MYKSIMILVAVALMTCLTAATKPKAVVTFIELGSEKCVPCKMMKPVMAGIEKEYKGKVEVIFYDVWKPEYKAMSSKYKVRVIPTQVLLDSRGKEFHRHEGFYPQEEMMKVIDAQLGIKRTKQDND